MSNKDVGLEFLCADSDTYVDFDPENNGSWGFINEDGSGSYHGADGSWGTRHSDGSGLYYGDDGSWGTRDSDGNVSYYRADGSVELCRVDNDRCHDDSSDASTSAAEGFGTLVALGLNAYMKHKKKRQEEEEAKEVEEMEEVREKRQEDALFFYADRDRMRVKRVRTKQRNHSGSNSILLWLFLIMLPVLIFGFIYLKHNQKVARLEQLEIEIEEAIKAGDYDLAVLKVNRLHLDDDYSKDESATWDAKREALLKFIEEKKHESDLADPNKIFMPADSSFFTGKPYVDVVDQLSALGFTNISVQVSSKSPGLFHRKGTIEHILVGGSTEFTVETLFDRDTPIIIYYYSK